MKSSVYPTPKRGDLTSQGEIETYLALLGGNHSLVPMLARHSSKTRDLGRLLIYLGGSLISWDLHVQEHAHNYSIGALLTFIIFIIF